MLADFHTLLETYQVIRAGWNALSGGQRLEARPSREEFSYIRDLQKKHRRHFAEIACRLPQYESSHPFFEHAPLLCDKGWIPAEPILLAKPGPELEDDSDQLVTTFTLPRSNGHGYNRHGRDRAFCAQTRALLPFQGAEPFNSFHNAIKELERPTEALFVSRPSYSLAKISATSGDGFREKHTLEFTESEYFDYIDCGEMLAYELILNLLRFEGHGAQSFERLEKALPLRGLAGYWWAPLARPSVAGVNMLTVFLDDDGAGSFPMLSRSKELGSAMGTLHVIPAGEFQPTTDSPPAFTKHCTLWQTILREFAEEVLRDYEAKSNDVDMQELARMERIAPVVKLIREGGDAWRTYYLGVALDPLTLKPEILTLSLIERTPLLEVIGDFLPSRKLPKMNSEGKFLRGPNGWGELLTMENLTKYRDHHKTLPAGSGCIELFLRHAHNRTLEVDLP